MASNIQKSAKTEGFGDEVSQWVSRVTAYSSQYDENRSVIFSYSTFIEKKTVYMHCLFFIVWHCDFNHCILQQSYDKHLLTLLNP